MSAASQSSIALPASTWTEPPWSGWIETTGDALLILEAARRGLIPRVTRRLVDSERKMIASGSVFVFDEDESGIKRWTDGFFWSPSRILGNFLLYRETDKRGAGHRRSDASTSDEHSQFNGDGSKLEGQTLSRPKSEGNQTGIDRHRERTLMGSLTNSYKFKPDGLMKKTFSVTIGGVSQHLISYYKIEDVEQGRLRAPSTLPELACLDISPEYLDKTHFRNPPKVEIGLDGQPRYRGEADDIESSDSVLTGPLSSSPPLDGEGSAGSSKRTKRFDPYISGAGKRSRKTKSTPQPSSSSPTEQSQHQPPPHTGPVPSQSSPPYPDSNLPVVASQPGYPPYGMPGFYPVQVPGYPIPPPHIPPVPASSPPTSQPQSSPTPQDQTQTPHHYSYLNYPQPHSQSQSNGTESTPPQPAHGSSQPHQTYYQYYPAHPGYAPVTWPQYAAYPPQPTQHQGTPPSSSEPDDKGKDGERVGSESA